MEEGERLVKEMRWAVFRSVRLREEVLEWEGWEEFINDFLGL